MKYVILCSFFLLISCSHLNKSEVKYVGVWEWKVEEQGYGESGSIELRNDGKYGYSIEFWNPTENHNIVSDNYYFDWYLDGDFICLEGSAGRHGSKSDECWIRVKREATQVTQLSIKGTALKREIALFRVRGS